MALTEACSRPRANVMECSPVDDPWRLGSAGGVRSLPESVDPFLHGLGSSSVQQLRILSNSLHRSGLAECRAVAKEDDVRRQRSIGEHIHPNPSDDCSPLVANRHGSHDVDVLCGYDTLLLVWDCATVRASPKVGASAPVSRHWWTKLIGRGNCRSRRGHRPCRIQGARSACREADGYPCNRRPSGCSTARRRIAGRAGVRHTHRLG